MAIQFKEEPVPTVEQVGFYVTNWGGLNKIDGFTEKNEMEDAINLTMDKYPFTAPVNDDLVYADFKQKVDGYNVPQDVIKIIEYNGEKYVLSNYALSDGINYYTALYKEFSENGVIKWEKVIDFGSTFKEKVSDTVWFNDKLIMMPNMYYYDFKNNKEGQLEQQLFFVEGEYSVSDRGTEYYDDVRQQLNSSYIPFDEITASTKINLNIDISAIDNELKKITNNSSETKYREYSITATCYAVNPEDLTEKKLVGDSVVKNATDIYYNDEVASELDFSFDSTSAIQNWMIQFVVVINLRRYRNSWDSWVKNFSNAIMNDARTVFTVVNGSIPDAIISPNYADVYKNRIVAVEKNNIHVSAQGNINNFGLVSDKSGNDDISGPWFTDVDGGEFVGVKTYQNYVILFQKSRSFVLSGNNTPFSVYELGKFGLLNARAVVECRGVLYWASPVGIVAYSGGQPTVISRKINVDFYGISGEEFIMESDMKNVYFYDGNNLLYCYYPDYDSWHVEKVPKITAMLCNESGRIYYVGQTKENTLGGDAGEFYILHESKKCKDFQFKTRKFNFYIKERKNVSRIWVRVKMEKHSELEVWVSADNGEFERCAVYQQDNDTMFDFKKRIRKCDYVQFMFKGRGNVQIQDLTAKITVGTSKHRSGKNLSVYRG